MFAKEITNICQDIKSGKCLNSTNKKENNSNETKQNKQTNNQNTNVFVNHHVRSEVTRWYKMMPCESTWPKEIHTTYKIRIYTLSCIDQKFQTR